MNDTNWPAAVVHDREERTTAVRAKCCKNVLNCLVLGDRWDRIEFAHQNFPRVVANATIVAVAVNHPLVGLRDQRQIQRWAIDPISLRKVAPNLAADPKLYLGLHAFGDNSDPQHMRKIHD